MLASSSLNSAPSTTGKEANYLDIVPENKNVLPHFIILMLSSVTGSGLVVFFFSDYPASAGFVLVGNLHYGVKGSDMP